MKERFNVRINLTLRGVIDAELNTVLQEITTKLETRLLSPWYVEEIEGINITTVDGPVVELTLAPADAPVGRQSSRVAGFTPRKRISDVDLTSVAADDIEDYEALLAEEEDEADEDEFEPDDDDEPWEDDLDHAEQVLRDDKWQEELDRRERYKEGPAANC